MAEIALSCVKQIFQAAKAIKEAVDRVRQNETECHKLKDSVGRITYVLESIDETSEQMERLGTSGAMQSLAKTVDDALAVIESCQEEMNIICLLFKSGDMSKELSRVKSEILYELTFGSFAINIGGATMLNRINQHPLLRRGSSLFYGKRNNGRSKGKDVRNESRSKDIGQRKRKESAGSDVSFQSLSEDSEFEEEQEITYYKKDSEEDFDAKFLTDMSVPSVLDASTQDYSSSESEVTTPAAEFHDRSSRDFKRQMALLALFILRAVGSLLFALLCSSAPAQQLVLSSANPMALSGSAGAVNWSANSADVFRPGSAAPPTDLWWKNMAPDLRSELVFMDDDSDDDSSSIYEDAETTILGDCSNDYASIFEVNGKINNDDVIAQNKVEFHSIAAFLEEEDSMAGPGASATIVKDEEMLDTVGDHGSNDDARPEVNVVINNDATAKNAVEYYSLPASFEDYSLSQLDEATHGFSEDSMVGRDDFATIYKGETQDGCNVMIKKFQHSSPSIEIYLYNELNILSELEHKNVVNVLGYHLSAEHRNDGATETYTYLVEEYMPNRGLHDNIYGPQRIHWSNRFLIIQGIAEGVCYLHEQSVVHMDLKPSNIFLDSNKNPKIVSFGLATRLQGGANYITRDDFTGSMGYMSPEYITEGTLSMKYDVYSFGVILLEIISSMCRSDLQPARHQASIEWAWKTRQALRRKVTGKRCQLKKLFDSTLCDKSHLKVIKRCIEIGLLCTQYKADDRPTMENVLQMLKDNNKELPTPKRPGYAK